MGIDWSQRTHWIFDMDGTLTIAVHDFAAIRAALGVPHSGGIIEAIDALPPAEAAAKHQQLAALELDYARRAQAQPSAKELLHTLRARGASLGILTRNNCENAFATLEACGLLDFFATDCILGRESAEPKPSSAGIELLLNKWEARATQAVMLGDFRYDLEAGRNAGTATVYVDVDDENAWTHLADLRVQSLGELMEQNAR
jgi:HAD superfamily hydrolase (TIGR01509 family)